MIDSNQIPQIIRDVGFDFSWDEKKVWALEACVENMPFAELQWHLDIPFLWHDTGIYNLTPRKVLLQPKKYPEEYERTQRADLSYPLDIMMNKGRWLILDGLHRLMKASIAGLSELQVRKISRSLIPFILSNNGSD